MSWNDIIDEEFDIKSNILSYLSMKDTVKSIRNQNIVKNKFKIEFPERYKLYKGTNHYQKYRKLYILSQMSKIFGEIPIVQEEYLLFFMKNFTPLEFKELVKLIEEDGDSYYIDDGYEKRIYSMYGT